jgi:nitroreductase
MCEKEKIEKLMEITAFAPSGHNSRPVEWIVYTEREKIKSLVSLVIQWMKSMEESSPEIAKSMHFDMITKAWDFGIDVITHNCPVLAIAHGKKSNPNTAAACSIALALIWNQLLHPWGLVPAGAVFSHGVAMTYGLSKKLLITRR